MFVSRSAFPGWLCAWARPVVLSLVFIFVPGWLRAESPKAHPISTSWGGPAAVVLNADETRAYMAFFESGQVNEFDLSRKVITRSFSVPGAPTGLALHGSELWVTCSAPASRICCIDLVRGKIRTSVAAGHTATSPVVTPDGQTLVFCLRFQDQIVLWDMPSHRERKRISVGREPVSVACARDGRYLLVAHHLPSGAANAREVAATVGIVDLQASTMVGEIALPNGSSLAREIQVSPDGEYAVLAHNLAHYQVPTTQVERGWMNTAAISVISLSTRTLSFSCVLDEVDRGAANPWGVGWSFDGRKLVISHAGTHELSRIDFPGLLKKISALRQQGGWDPQAPSEDLSFLLGLRDRIALGGNGPRALAVGRNQVYVAGHFSDTLETADLSGTAGSTLVLRPEGELTAPNLAGERLFNDASLCFQGWQSCASCHSEQARVDGLNWDLLNDGLGNPKNSKSLLWSHRTPPAMSMGVRITAQAAVRAGIRHILFAEPREAVARPIDEWLKSLEPIPSPWLERGKLSAAARRGKEVFNRSATGCAVCHRPGLFTDLQRYDVGTSPGMASGELGSGFDTPSLVELWCTAPYLHDGSAADLRAVLTTRNIGNHHGNTSQLSESELNDLIAYLLAL